MKNIILVVDDVELNREILVEMLEDEFRVLEAANGDEALALLQQHYNEIEVVLLDLVMPKLDGISVLKYMNDRGWNKKIPVLIISGENSQIVEAACFEDGIYDFIHKPFERMYVKRRVMNAAELYRYKNSLEEKVAEQTEALRAQNQRLEELNSDIIESLSNVVEARNLESGLHIRRVKGFTKILTERVMRDWPEYGIDEARKELIVSASALHDIGKIMIRDIVLLKPGRLTKEEFDEIKTHTTKGCEIIRNMMKVWDSEYFNCSYNICRHHHERYDGKGYPDGLAGDAIPISAQIVSLADVYDALTSERIYKKAYSCDRAYNMVVNGECGAFSPKLLSCFAACKTQMADLAKRLAGQRPYHG
ncbi:MAG: response regulator [Ruminococcaceae bacterium]|nr:response regulator [Oscillospiraceae bacterium]